ncbi:MAG: hypothetical protein ACD_50C00392G0006, partial [uncultured bacterium]
PAFALASDSKDTDLIKDKPRDPKTSILTKNRIIFVLGVGLALSTLFIFLFSLILSLGGSETFARTIVFNALIFTHMGIAFIVRGKSMFKYNPFLVWGVLVIIILQVVITFTPALQNIFHLGF